MNARPHFRQIKDGCHELTLYTVAYQIESGFDCLISPLQTIA